MNKISIGLIISAISILLFIGGIVYYEMTSELLNNPDIKDIGGPPVITDLRLVTIVIVGALIFCCIALKMNPKEDNNNEKITKHN